MGKPKMTHLLTLLVFMFAMLVVGADVQAAQRYEGENRSDTAFKAAQDLYGTTDTVIIAEGRIMADSMVGNLLAGALDVPILIWDSHMDKDYNVIAMQVATMGASKAYVLGGETAIPAELVHKLPGVEVIRVAGDDRFQTSVAIINEAKKHKELGSVLYVANGRGETIDGQMKQAPGFALAAVGDVTRVANPVLLVDYKNPSKIKELLDAITINFSTIHIIGDTNQVPEVIVDILKEKGYQDFNRNTGNLAKISVDLAEYHIDTHGLTNIVIARSDDVADALAAGLVAAKNNAHVLFIDKNTTELSPGIKKVLQKIKPNGKAIIMGGESAVTKQIEEMIQAELNAPSHPIPNQFPKKIVLNKTLPAKINIDEMINYKIIILDQDDNQITDLSNDNFRDYIVQVDKLSKAENIIETPCVGQSYALSELASDLQIVAGLNTGVETFTYALKNKSTSEVLDVIIFSIQVEDSSIQTPIYLDIVDLSDKININTTTYYRIDVLDKLHNIIKGSPECYSDYIVHVNKLTNADDIIKMPSVGLSYEMSDLGCDLNGYIMMELTTGMSSGKETITYTLEKKSTSEIIYTKTVTVEVVTDLSVPTKLILDKAPPVQIFPNEAVCFKLSVVDQYGSEIDYNNYNLYSVSFDKLSNKNDIILIPAVSLIPNIRYSYSLSDLSSDLQIVAGSNTGKETITFILKNLINDAKVDSLTLDIDVIGS